MTEPIFVFGSNLAGRHGKGAALWARQHRGANYGQGIGLQGNSYAIPSKDSQLRTLPLAVIKQHVSKFLAFARSRPELTFQLTPIGAASPAIAVIKSSRCSPMHHRTFCGHQNGADEIVALSRFTDNRPNHVPFHRDTLLDIEHDLEDDIIDSLS